MKFNKISLKNYVEIPEEQRNGIYEIKNWATYYYVNGKCHRLDGPAIELGSIGEKQYYIEGKEYLTKEEFELAAYMYKNGLHDYL